MADQSQTHDASSVIQEANVKFDADDLQGAQMVYQSALLTWVDDATFGSPSQKQQITSAVATLWIAYADLNRRANMFKAATDTYEAAVNCPIAGTIGIVWSSYAKFQQERNRNKTAQKVYIRALVGENEVEAKVASEQECDDLWKEFLEMMHSLNQSEGDTLSMEQLKEAVRAEHNAAAKIGIRQPGNVKAEPMDQYNDSQQLYAFSQAPQAADIEEPTLKRAKLADANSMSESSTVLPASVEAAASEIRLRISVIPPEIKAEWLVLDGNSSPCIPSPPLFSPSPPRLSDPSGKELLGTEISLKLIQMLIGDDYGHDGGVQDSTDLNVGGNAIVETCRACWLMTALKEREAAVCMVALDKKLAEDVRRMDVDLEARLSVAGAALVAVQQINANEKEAFIASCNSQRQHLQSLVAWEFRLLLAQQQQIFTNTGLPEFNGPTVENVLMYKQSAICSFLHSAFYLRNRIGDKAHLAMLKSQEVRLKAQEVTPMPVPVGVKSDESVQTNGGHLNQHLQYPQQSTYNMVQHSYAQQGVHHYH